MPLRGRIASICGSSKIGGGIAVVGEVNVVVMVKMKKLVELFA